MNKTSWIAVAAAVTVAAVAAVMESSRPVPVRRRRETHIERTKRMQTIQRNKKYHNQSRMSAKWGTP